MCVSPTNGTSKTSLSQLGQTITTGGAPGNTAGQPATYPTVCPGCGRCNTCGRGGANPAPYIPWIPTTLPSIPSTAPAPGWYNPDWTWRPGDIIYSCANPASNNAGQWSFHLSEKPLYGSLTYHFNT